MQNDRLPKLLQFLQQSPEDAFLLFAVAKEYEKRGDDTQAETHYQKLLDIHPDYTGLYYHLGKLHERNGNISRAIEIYDMGIAACNRVGAAKDRSELNGARMNLEIDH